MQNLTVQKLCIGLITLGFFVLAPWMISQILEGNPLPFFFLLGIGVLLLFLFVLKDRCWMVIPFSLPIEGRLNFLPLNFSMQETAVIAVIAYIFIQVVMGRQIHWRLGPKIIWLPLAGLLAILLYHWISSGDIGIRALGGTGWGGRKYFSILLAVAKEEAEQASYYKTSFLAVMSHEIRTPMNGVLGMLDLLSKTDLTESQRSYLRMAQFSADSLLGLINDILDFSKIEAGKMDLEQIEFDLLYELENIVQTMAPTAYEKGLEFIFEMYDLPGVIVNGKQIGRAHV